ncbi:tyrosine-type recombinase/integrase [Algoriphagus namhaensis]|uniref:Tyrosine-type recombinase/integrase n=1 Tax=Algoriphagus namhaensis TaxID=915353 RepID=A0ABV8ALG9_9BACT
MILSKHTSKDDSLTILKQMNKSKVYSGSSLQEVLKSAVKKAGIKKPVTLHWLRHSFATLLLKGRTDPWHIQELLGHNPSKPTKIYTHVSRKNLRSTFTSEVLFISERSLHSICNDDFL